MKPLNFVQKRRPGYCWVRHRPGRPDAGNGLCEECEEIVAREGIAVPARVRGEVEQPAPTAVVASATEEVAGADIENPPPPPNTSLPDVTRRVIGSVIVQQDAYLAEMERVAAVVPNDTQEALDDLKEVLDDAHARATQLRKFLEHYLAPLKAAETSYRSLIFPTVKRAEAFKSFVADRIREGLQLAEGRKVAAIKQIEASAQSGQEIPDDAITSAQGYQVAGTREIWKWRFVEGKTAVDLATARPHLTVPSKAAIDGLVRIMRDSPDTFAEATGGVLEMYKDFTPAASSKT